MAKIYRTRANAAKENQINSCPNKLAIPTLPNYENSISLHPEGKAYLQHLISTKGLRFEDGEMFFEGALEPISTVALQDMHTNEGIENIDIPLLTAYYSIILAQYQERLKKGDTLWDITSQITTVYAPELAKCLGIITDGKSGGLHKSDIMNIMEKTKKFHDIIGIMHITRNGKNDKSYFPVLNFEGYDAKNNTISFFSPYLIYIVKEIYSASIQRDKKGQPKLNRNNQAILEPSHSFILKSSIASERNKAAVENVMIIVKVIVQTGNRGVPHIKASTIIERNEILKWRLSKDNHPSRLLSRVFSKTWELLRDKTELLDIYREIVLPDPQDIRNIPTVNNVNEIVFSFPHKGKIIKQSGESNTQYKITWDTDK